MTPRPPFRRRLTLALGLALGLALATLGVLVWLGALALTTVEARAVLQAEAASVERATAAPDGLDTARYDWDEPHHRFAAPRIDPIFLQVFDSAGRLLRASDNLAALPNFPAGVLPSTDGDGAVTPLARLTVDGKRLYRITEPLRTADGRPVGTVQLARFDPGLGGRLARLGAWLAAGLGLLFAALMALVWGIGGRVVRPLEAITDHAAGLSAATLGGRVPVPPDADRETAALAAALNGALARLDGSFAEMQRFTANAAHELQTPLTVLRGHIEVALRRDRAPEAYRDTLRLLLTEATDMAQAVRGLLELARLDDGTGLPTESVNLADIARDEAAAFHDRAAEKRLQLTVRAAPAPVCGHADLLRDVARTLLDNALKYTDAGGITVASGVDCAEACLVVEDTGPGIADVDRATDRFWRADAVQHLPGSGLGLAIARRIVESHGGRLVVGASACGGARVEARLPVLPDAPGPHA